MSFKILLYWFCDWNLPDSLVDMPRQPIDIALFVIITIFIFGMAFLAHLMILLLNISTGLHIHFLDIVNAIDVWTTKNRD